MVKLQPIHISNMTTVPYLTNMYVFQTIIKETLQKLDVDKSL